MPGGSTFIDTNVLLYAHDRLNQEKAIQSKEWLNLLASRGLARVNLQTLNELTSVLLRKKWFEDVATVYAVVDQFAVLGTTPVTYKEIATARTIHLRYGYSWWDCLLLASALELGCQFFLSEDLQDGQAIEGLTIVDPFAHSPQQVFASR
ncbi:PIN domain-containing protein [Mesorhizobium sp. KR2-14]|uniref:PIN domain-containing protein n=1 Tax=Mesorhizobium sp. KR2-14 TaxID=3156610 RepID=UPI0032B35EF5